MADIKITALVEDTGPTLDDLLVMVNDPGGVPVTRKVTIENLLQILLSGGNYLVFDDIIIKSPFVDIRAFMDGVAGRPTYATWVADQTTTDVTACLVAAAAAAAGKILYAPQGFTFLVSTFDITADMIVTGGGTLKQAVLDAEDGSPIINIIGSNVTIDGIIFDGNKAAQPVDGFSDSYDTGLLGTGRAYRAAVKMDAETVPGIENLTVLNCKFLNTYGAGVATRAVPHIIFTDNQADGLNFELGFFYDSSPTSGLNHDLIVSNNSIRNTGSGDAGVNGNGFTISLYDVVVFEGNTADTVERALVKFEICSNLTVKENILKTNTITDYAFMQFSDGTTNATISGNIAKTVGRGFYFSSTTGTDIFSGIKIQGNVIDTTTSATVADGIICDGILNDSVIDGNIFKATDRHGMLILGGNRIKIINNTLYGSGDSVGIYLVLYHNSTEIDISNNQVSNFVQVPGGYVLWITRSAAETLSGLTITGNKVDAGGVLNGGIIVENFPTAGVIRDNIVNGIFISYAGMTSYNNKVTGVYYCINTIPALANDATPSISGSDKWLTGGITTITDFDDGVEGQIITIISEHAITITDGTNIFLNGSANFVMAATDTLTLIQKADGKWYEISRSVNST